MFVPIQARTKFTYPGPLNADDLDEGVTAFNSELSQAFQPAGRVIGILPGISNLLRLDVGGSVLTFTVTFAVLCAGDQPSIQELADGFTSTRFSETEFSIVTAEQMERLRGLRDFASTHASAHEHGADRISDVAADITT
jgi:hypothetical protein